MHTDIKRICQSLSDLSNSIIASFPPQNDSTFSDHWGWLAPSVTRRDAAEHANKLSADLQSLETYPSTAEISVDEVIRRLSHLQNQTIPYMYNGNIGQAYPAYVETLQAIRNILLPQRDWVSVSNRTTLPAQIVRKAAAAQSRIDELSTAIPHLAKKIEEINTAHAVADNLEVDLQALAEARAKVEKAATEASVQAEKIKLLLSDSAAALKKLSADADTATQLVAQCEEAYHITTTKGLAGAFDQRAKSLSWSMRGWVAGLSIALIAGSLLGAARLATITQELSTDNPKWALVVSQIVLAVLSIGAPLWFAWLATKQIGQRFRLAEDYAFKASVAKAYEGYRKEAAILDPEFQATLFRSALGRLDEAPLRLVETQQHASPLQEFANSDLVKSALKIAPDLQSKFMTLVTDTLNQSKAAAGEAAKVLSDAKNSANALPPKQE